MSSVIIPEGLHAPRVLIVDDRPDNLLSIEAILEPLPCQPVRATSGEDALRHLLHDDFAVILLDVQMPGLDGYETATHIKARERTRNIPLIFLTAIDREHRHHLRGYGTGAVDFLAKPLDPDVLRAKVRVFLDLYTQAELISAQARALADRLEERDAAQAALAHLTTELQRSNAQLELFALAASHDLAEPAQVVAGLLSLLRERSGERLDSTEVELLDRARHSVTVILETLAGLLQQGRAAGPSPASPVDLGRVVEEAIGQLQGRLRAAGAAVEVGTLPTVAGDAWQLQQVFVELLANAITFAGGPVHIHIASAREGDDWIVMVRDNGPGISPADLPVLFTLEQASGPRARPTGLAVCRRTLERHGGRLWTEGAEGGGTTVCLALPVAEP